MRHVLKAPFAQFLTPELLSVYVYVFASNSKLRGSKNQLINGAVSDRRITDLRQNF